MGAGRRILETVKRRPGVGENNRICGVCWPGRIPSGLFKVLVAEHFPDDEARSLLGSCLVEIVDILSIPVLCSLKNPEKGERLPWVSQAKPDVK